MRRLAADRPAAGNVILVTYEVNITALTWLYLDPGEMIILAPQGDAGFRVAGRLALLIRLSE